MVQIIFYQLDMKNYSATAMFHIQRVEVQYMTHSLVAFCLQGCSLGGQPCSVKVMPAYETEIQTSIP